MANKRETTERYTGLWNKIKANNVDLSNLETMGQEEFYKQIGSTAKSNGTYNLAKSLARNTERQEDVNKYIEDKQIPAVIVPKIEVKEYIEPVKKRESQEGLDFSQDTSEDDYESESEDASEGESEEDYGSEDPTDNDGSLDPEYERLRVYLQDYFPTRKDAGKDIEEAFKKEIKNWDSLAADTRQGLITDWTNFIECQVSEKND